MGLSINRMFNNFGGKCDGASEVGFGENASSVGVLIVGDVFGAFGQGWGGVATGNVRVGNFVFVIRRGGRASTFEANFDGGSFV